MFRSKPISGDLLELQRKVQGYADDYGLDYFPQIFEMCDYDTINILAAQGGFPIRYPHWKFGMDYDQMSKGYRYGIQKIYEMVINTNPCYAYLLEVNNWLDQKLVMAHVYGHNDFFKNNMWFSNTNRSMMDVMANNGTKIRRYMEKYGQNKIEQFIDKVLSLENLIDISQLHENDEVIRKRKILEEKFKEEQEIGGYLVDDRSQALKSFMRAQERESQKTEAELKEEQEDDILAEKNLWQGEKDILKFLIASAPIEDWQADVISCLRAEAYYFLPQRVTKIMNEGWASYWHSKIMTEKLMEPNDFVDFAIKHGGVMAMSKQNINPYKIGIELMRDIEFRWNTGRFGKEYNECTDMYERENWDRKTMEGRDKIFSVRRSHNDISFIDEFLTPEFCNRQKLFTYKYNPRTQQMEIDTRDFLAIKNKLLMGLSNFGQPIIQVEDSNYKNRKELLIKHIHTGVDLDMQFANSTLRNLQSIWKRPVTLTTSYEDKEVLVQFDGKDFSIVNQ
ncbi:MAG: SpoVR family protein [Halobacteriovoraceae bacterium]|nr:SpoVR family protein [Halobacteriovoraceae bacterium]|tara:strand:+ start:27260 stop:28777 length:1518 start_codon:yes stop_codon:yes gene_type:complete